MHEGRNRLSDKEVIDRAADYIVEDDKVSGELLELIRQHAKCKISDKALLNRIKEIQCKWEEYYGSDEFWTDHGVSA
jgi:hypothetical protein